MKDAILARLKEPSTWRGIIIILGIFGVNFSPEKSEAIVAAGVALLGLIEVFRKESVPGGKFNPNAPVKPAEPVRTQGRGRLT